MSNDEKRNELTLVQKVRDYFLNTGDFYEQKSKRRKMVWGLQALVPELDTSKEVEEFAEQCNSSFLKNLLIYVNYDMIADQQKGKFAKEVCSRAREHYLMQVLQRLKTALNEVSSVPDIYDAIASLVKS